MNVLTRESSAMDFILTVKTSYQQRHTTQARGGLVSYGILYFWQNSQHGWFLSIQTSILLQETGGVTEKVNGKYLIQTLTCIRFFWVSSPFLKYHQQGVWVLSLLTAKARWFVSSGIIFSGAYFQWCMSLFMKTCCVGNVFPVKLLGLEKYHHFWQLVFSSSHWDTAAASFVSYSFLKS